MFSSATGPPVKKSRNCGSENVWVAGDEVDALLGLAFLVPVDLGAAHEPVGHSPYRTRLPSEEGANIVAEPAVPLLPAVADEAADLGETGRVPRLGNELRARERGIRLDIPQDGRVRERVARGVAREIEPEAVDTPRP
jgi:hypothetical protein